MAKPSWLSVTPTSGSGHGKIENSSAEYTGRVKREGIVTVTGSGVAQSKTYKVIQTPKSEFVSFSGTELTVSIEGGSVTIEGYSNSSKLTFAWVGTSDVSLPNNYFAAGQTTSNGASILGDPGATAQYRFNFTIAFPPNTDIYEDVRVLKVTAAGGQSSQLTIRQAAEAAYLSVSPTEVTIPQAGGSVSVQVTSNTNWTVS